MGQRFQHSGTVSTIVLSCALLGCLAAYRVRFQAPPQEADAYQRRVRDTAAQMPLQIGSWVGRDVPVTQGAVALLHPNVIISRQYTDMVSGRSVGFLLVQCSDARDILGHYPPICYVMHGWTGLDTRKHEWDVAGMRIWGMEYEYSKMSEEQSSHISVCDFMLLPDGRTCGDMDTVDNAAKSYRTRFFGAAQVQLECDVSIPASERDGIFEMVLQAAKPILNSIGTGVST